MFGRKKLAVRSPILEELSSMQQVIGKIQWHKFQAATGHRGERCQTLIPCSFLLGVAVEIVNV